MINRILFLLVLLIGGAISSVNAQCPTDITTSDDLCPNSVVTFEAPGCPSAYLWTVATVMTATVSIDGSSTGSTVDVTIGPLAGTFSVQLDTNGTLALLDTFTTLTPPATDAGGPYGPTCDDGSIIALSGMPTGSAGVWSGMGVTDANGNNGDGDFDPDGLSGDIDVIYTFTDGIGCAASDTVVITVNASPSMSGVNTDESCSGSTHTSFTLASSPGGSTFAWTTTKSNIEETIPGGSGATIVGTPLTLTSGSSSGDVTYAVTPTLNGCTGDPVDYVVTVNPIPEIDLITTNCTGAVLINVIVTASIDGGGTLEYNVDGGTYSASNVFTGLSFGNHDFGVRRTTTTTCEIIQTEDIQCSCPIISNNTISGGESICPGDSPGQITGLMASTSSGTFTYQWQISDAGANSWSDIVGALTQNHTPSSPSVSSDYRRLVKVLNCPDDISNTVTITINSLPSAPTAGPAVFNCEGTTPNPPVTATVTGGNHIDWYSASSGGTLLLADSPTYVSPETGDGTYLYYAETVNNTTMCSSSSRTSVQLTIAPLPDQPSNPGNQVTCEGTSPNPAVSAMADAGEHIDWYSASSGGTLLQSSSNTYVSPATMPNVYMYYAEAVDNTTMCKSSSRREVTLTIFPTPNTPTEDQGNVSNCEGSANLAVTANVGPGETVDWYSVPTGGTILDTGPSYTSMETAPATYTYYAEARQTGGGFCKSNARYAVTLTIIGRPNNTINGNDQENCQGTIPNPALTSSAGAGEEVDWYLGSTGGSAIFTGTNFVSSETAPGVYTYFTEARNTTSGCLSPTRQSITLTIFIRPAEPTGEANVFNCQGTTPNPALIAVVGGGEVVRWYLTSSGGTAIFTGTNFVSSETAPGMYNYFAEAVNGNSCASSTRKEFTLTINARPAVPVSGGDVVNCQGTTPNPAVIATVPGGVNVDWYLNPTGGTSIFTGTNYVSSETGVGTYSYFAEARNTSNGCLSATRTEVKLVINARPNAPTAGATVQNCEGITPNPAISATPPAGAVVDWYLNPTGGSPIASGNTYVSPETAVGSYSYYAESRNENPTCLSATRTEVILVINETPVFAGLEVNCDGGSLESVEVAFIIGSGTLEFRVDNGTYQASNIFTGLSIGMHTFDAQVIGTGCFVSSGAQEINCACPAVANNTIAQGQLICGGETPAQLTGGEATAQGENFTYQWQSKTAGSSTWVNVGTERDYSPGPLTQTTDYRRLVIVAACPDNISNEVKITIKPDPAITNAITEETICAQNISSGFILTSAPSGATYSWSAMAANVVGNSVSGNGNIPGELLQLSNGDISGQVTYTVTPTLNSCTGPVEEFLVNVATLPEFIIVSGTGSDVICPGQMTTLSPSGLPAGNYNYQWQLPGGGTDNSETINVSVTGSTDNSFTLTVTETTSPFCSFSQTFVFMFSDFNPDLTLIPNSSNICDGDEISFSASGGNKFTWMGFDAPADLTTSFFSATPPVGSNNYSVQIENSDECTQLIEEVIVVNARPTPNIITNTNGTEFCENEIVTLSTEIPYEVYDWSTNSSSNMISFVANPASTDFDVTVIDDKGCTNSDDITLVIRKAATAEICNFIDGDECLVLVADSGLPVTFTAFDIDPDPACSDIKEYQWVFKKDGVVVRTETVTTPELDITFTTEDEGINSVELVILDGCDCLSLAIVNTEFKVKSNEKCGASITTVGKACLETIHNLKATPTSGTGTFNDPVEGYFIIEGENIIEGITVVGSPISPATGKDFIIHSIEQDYESSAGLKYNDILTIEYLEVGDYAVEYYYDFSVCVETVSKNVSVAKLPKFLDVIVDLEACDGEDFVQFEFVPDGTDVSWNLSYTKGGSFFNEVLNDDLGYILEISTAGVNDIDIVFQTLLDVVSTCENDIFDVKEFTINKLDPVSATYTSVCNLANDSIFYTLAIAGGTGNYSIDNVAVVGNEFETKGYKPAEPQVLFIEDEGCDDENITPINNIIGVCDFCLPLDTFTTKLQVDVTNSIDICENEIGKFSFDFSNSVLTDKNSDGKVDYRDTLLPNQTILYVIQKIATNEYEEENVLVKYKPVNQQFADISSFDLVFEDALDSVLVAGTEYFLTAFVVPNSTNIIAPEGECKGLKSIPIQFYIAPVSMIDLSLEEDITFCNQEIDYQIWRDNSAQNDVWSSSDPVNVFIETDVTNNRALIAFGTGIVTDVDIYLTQNNDYNTLNGILTCTDGDTITLELIPDKIAPVEDSIIWFPGNFLTYTDPGKCYEWGYIEANGNEVTTSETTRFYIYDAADAFENKIFFVDVWECDTDANKQCVTRVYYNASAPPVLNYKPDANYIVELFPNPHRGEFILKLDGEQAGIFQTKVYNATGILVHTHEFTKKSKEHEEIYSFDNLTDGLYIIQVVDEGGLTNLIKMIKQ